MQLIGDRRVAKPIVPVLNITKLEQVCMVIHDVDKTVGDIWNTFGIGPWEVYIRNADTMQDMFYLGKPAYFGLKAARAQNKLDGMEIELIEPMEGESIFSDFLREHGEGIQHLSWYRVPTLEAFAETLKLASKGFPLPYERTDFL